MATINNTTTTPTHDNNGTPYTISIDDAKEGAQLFDLTPWFKGRVGDNLSPLDLLWHHQGRISDLTNLKPVVNGNVGHYSFEKDSQGITQMVMASDASTVYQEGNPSDCQAGGRVTYRFSSQIFPKEGAFKGYLGLMDTATEKLVSSIDVWFKVLPGIAQMGIACDYYIDVLDKAITNAQEKLRQHDIDYQAALTKAKKDFEDETQQAITEVKQKYQQIADASEAAATTARASLNKLTATVGDIQAQIDAGNVVTRQTFNQKSTELSNAINERLSQIHNNIQAYANLDEIKSKFPNGAEGPFLAIDTGHQWYYQNGDWHDAGIYQAAGLPDDKLAVNQIAWMSQDPVSVKRINGEQVTDFGSGDVLVYLGAKKYGLLHSDLIELFKASPLVTVDTNEKIHGHDWALVYRRTDSSKFKIIDYTDESQYSYQDTILLVVQNYHVGGLLNSDAIDQEIRYGTSDISTNNLMGNLNPGRVWNSVITNLSTSFFPSDTDHEIHDSWETASSTRPGFGLTYTFESRNLGSDPLILNYAISGGLNVEVSLSDTPNQSGKVIEKITDLDYTKDKIHYSKVKIDANDIKKYLIVKSLDAGSISVVNMNASDVNGNQFFDEIYHNTANKLFDVPLNASNVISFFDQSKIDFVNKKAVNSEKGAVVLLLSRYMLPLAKPVYVEVNANFYGSPGVWLGANNGIGIDTSSRINYEFNGKTLRFVVSPSFWASLSNSYELCIVLSQPAMIESVKIGNYNFFKDEYSFGGVPEGIGDKTDTVDGLTLIGAKKTIDKAGYITEITAKVTKAGSYAFKIGKLDQNNLLVSAREFKVDLTAGLSSYYLVDPVKISKDEMLFMVPQDTTVYSMQAGNPHALIQDNSHPTTNPGYSGQMLYESAYHVPFSATIKTQDKNFATEIDQKIKDTAPDVSAPKYTKITSKSGKRFVLSVSDDGQLSARSAVPSKIAVFGNSLTSHTWFQGWGMAADHGQDWYSLLVNYTKAQNPDVKATHGGLLGWEGEITIDGHQKEADKIVANLDADTDLVILQFGDNVNADNRRKDLTTNVVNLIKTVKAKAPNALIYVIACWFNASNLPAIKIACDEQGVELVDITNLYRPENYGSVGETRQLADGSIYTITDNGVAIHPNDRGMAAIFNKLQKKLMY